MTDPNDPNRRWKLCSCGCDRFSQATVRRFERVVTGHNNVDPDYKAVERHVHVRTICLGCGRPAVDLDPLGMNDERDNWTINGVDYSQPFGPHTCPSCCDKWMALKPGGEGRPCPKCRKADSSPTEPDKVKSRFQAGNCPACGRVLEEIKGHDGQVAETRCLFGCGWKAP